VRRFRHIFLLALVAGLAVVLAVYRAQQATQAARQPVIPPSLPQDVQATSRDWVYFKDKDGTSAELHVYVNAGHGFGLRSTLKGPVATWIDRFYDWLGARGFLARS